MSFYTFARALACTTLGWFYKVRTEGKENIPPKGGYLLCANHRTNADPVFVGGATPHQLHFMAKAELFRNPLFGLVIRHLGAFPIERGKGDTAAIDTAISILKGGNAMVMFPEGTRSKDGKPLRPKSGAAMLAFQTGADILPVSISFGKKLSFRCGVTIRIGKVIKNEELGITALVPSQLKHASALIMERIVENLDPVE
ncbi:lysophospholipid acyltransferase family protein [Zongyangia hominis]|uniref:1-acyl-sn-glycerol-3-phosphate acyltransferase n=1 Tax=Zongyangia hominis TaxID=2763677 RepID=A0A926IBA4_9FIRM|nr:lysophospholipid acyltransferase family protein [Zongyangia hominis]MBC8570078.1 1-acyl-sn-glycerol-3-phosphate acyltransferase [Zongyangia hominis]